MSSVVEVTPQSSMENTYVELRPLLQFSYKNKQYKITCITQRIGENGPESHLDLQSLTADQAKVLTQQAIKVMGALEQGMVNWTNKIQPSGSFTLQFSQPAPLYHPITHLVGRVVPRFAPSEEPITLRALTYKETHDAETKTICVAQELSKKPKELETIHTSLKPLNSVIRYITNQEQVSENKPSSSTSPQAKTS